MRSRNGVSRSKAKKKRGLRIIILFGTLLVVSAVAASIYAYRYLTASDQFVVHQLVINGTEFADHEHIRTAVGEVTQGNMLMVDLADVCRVVETVPWVDEAAARKVLPDSLHIDITESVPRAYALLGGELFLVDVDGTVIDALRPEHPFIGLPILHGLDDPEQEAVSKRLVLGSRLLSTIYDSRPEWFEMISDIDLADVRGIQIRLQTAKAPIIVDDNDIISQLSKYFMIEASLQERYDRADYFDVRYKKRVVVKGN